MWRSKYEQLEQEKEGRQAEATIAQRCIAKLLAKKACIAAQFLLLRNSESENDKLHDTQNQVIHTSEKHALCKFVV